jgi:hypothetical protein
LSRYIFAGPAHKRLACAQSCDDCVMVKAAPATFLVVSETDFLLESEIVTLNPPAQLGLIDRAFK